MVVRWTLRESGRGASLRKLFWVFWFFGFGLGDVLEELLANGFGGFEGICCFRFWVLLFGIIFDVRSYFQSFFRAFVWYLFETP